MPPDGRRRSVMCDTVISLLRASRVAIRTGAVLLVACLAPLTVLGAETAGGASASPEPLSRVIVSTSLPGYTVLPPGPFNGPIPKAVLDGYSSQPQWQEDVAAGRLTGYQRSWGRVYAQGPSVLYVSAFRLPSRSYSPLFMSSIAATASKAPGAKHVDVQGMKGAKGFTTKPHAELGYGSGHWIIFTKGALGFFVYAVVPTSGVSSAQLTDLARQQLAQAPTR